MASNRQHTVILPTQRSAADSSQIVETAQPSEARPGVSDPVNTSEQKPWKPSFNRQQSWNTQDMKREMQTRLLETVEGSKSGFTEKTH